MRLPTASAESGVALLTNMYLSLKIVLNVHNGRNSRNHKVHNIPQDTRIRVALFIEKVDKLTAYTAQVQNLGGLFGIIRNTQEELWRTHPEIYGFIVTYRLFILESEGIALYPIPKKGQPTRPTFLDLPGLSDTWHRSVEQLYKQMSDFLALTPPGLVYNGEPIPRWEILKTFIYGEYIHTTQRKALKQWENTPELYEKLLSAFASTLAFTFFEYIRPIAAVSKQELTSPQPTHQENRLTSRYWHLIERNEELS